MTIADLARANIRALSPYQSARSAVPATPG